MAEMFTVRCGDEVVANHIGSFNDALAVVADYRALVGDGQVMCVTSESSGAVVFEEDSEYEYIYGFFK